MSTRWITKGKGVDHRHIPITSITPNPSFQKSFIRTQDGFKIFFVNGTFIRDHIDIDFTMGGHGYRFPFIPKDEIWIEQGMNDKDATATIAHELKEAEEMKSGKTYSQAHEKANTVEERFRSENAMEPHKRLTFKERYQILKDREVIQEQIDKLNSELYDIQMSIREHKVSENALERKKIIENTLEELKQKRSELTKKLGIKHQKGVWQKSYSVLEMYEKGLWK